MELSGIQPNCSETVIRLYKEDYDSIPPDVMSKIWMLSEPTEDYSTMRPVNGMECVYFYQSSGQELIDYLERNKIIYEIEAPFGSVDPNWELIVDWEPSGLDSFENSKRYFRRKPYGDNEGN